MACGVGYLRRVRGRNLHAATGLKRKRIVDDGHVTDSGHLEFQRVDVLPWCGKQELIHSPADRVDRLVALPEPGQFGVGQRLMPPDTASGGAAC